MADVISWFKTTGIPDMILLSEEYSEFVFEEGRESLLLIRSKADENAPFVKLFSEAATKLKGSVLFVTMGFEEE